jgi:phospholipase/carboxylesterase
MSDQTDELLDATTALLPPLLGALDALSAAGRRLHPQDVRAIAQALRPFQAPLAEGRNAFAETDWPEHLTGFRDCGMEASRLAQRALSDFSQSAGKQQPVMAAYKALGYLSRAQDALYPLTRMLPPVSRFFLDSDCLPEPGDAALDARAQLLCESPELPNTGVMHAGNGEKDRGGFSLYVPETIAEGDSAPLIVALHGGSGHGRSFLWSWLRAARSCGAILLAPTAAGSTWSIGEPEVDSGRLQAMLEFVRERFELRADRMLLTGMSDGGTFSYLAGLASGAPFSHIAPMAASFHPLILDMLDAERVQSVPVYLLHGTKDWMFDVDVARTAQKALEAAGASVTYRELEDLSHAFPAGELGPVVRWFLQDS